MIEYRLPAIDIDIGRYLTSLWADFFNSQETLTNEKIV